MKALSATVKIQEDAETGDLVLPIPDDWLYALDWRVGDKLRWRKLSTGDWELTNRTKAERETGAKQFDHNDADTTSIKKVAPP
jgi:hypothetical protein